MTDERYSKMLDRDLIALIKDPNTKEYTYQKACETILDRYSRQIHKNWWVLQKQMNASGIVNSLKEDYYDEAYESFFKAIQKTDLDKIENDNWKFVGMLNWYLANVRKKMIREATAKGKTKGLSTMSLIEDEDSSTIDSDVESAYQASEGYKNDPAYAYEAKNSEILCQKGLDHCLHTWTEKERKIYGLLERKHSRASIAQIMNMPPSKVYSITRKMYSDLKEAIGY